mmetsp:Transcript_4683/g.19972  ORF Transcript_4683/g.19972 Transcript_4683/m.19972 type:complete len:239 (+) Transcript_4683:759-1475(+)
MQLQLRLQLQLQLSWRRRLRLRPRQLQPQQPDLARAGRAAERNADPSGPSMLSLPQRRPWCRCGWLSGGRLTARCRFRSYLTPFCPPPASFLVRRRLKPPATSPGSTWTRNSGRGAESSAKPSSPDTAASAWSWQKPTPSARRACSEPCRSKWSRGPAPASRQSRFGSRFVRATAASTWTTGLFTGTAASARSTAGSQTTWQPRRWTGAEPQPRRGHQPRSLRLGGPRRPTTLQVMAP